MPPQHNRLNQPGSPTGQGAAASVANSASQANLRLRPAIPQPTRLPQLSNLVPTLTSFTFTAGENLTPLATTDRTPLPPKLCRALETASELSDTSSNSSYTPSTGDLSPPSTSPPTRLVNLRSRNVVFAPEPPTALLGKRARNDWNSGQESDDGNSTDSDDYRERTSRRVQAHLTTVPTAREESVSEEEEQEEEARVRVIPTPPPPSNPPFPANAAPPVEFTPSHVITAPAATLNTGPNVEIGLQQRFRRLAHLPTVFKPLPTHTLRHFGLACERLAEAYLASPSDQTLLDILALPKVGLVPAVNSKTPSQAKTLLESYPAVPWPQALPPIHLETQSRIVKLVEAGRLSSAARSLVGQAKIADVTPEVIRDLKEKHPRGPTDPFPRAPGPLPAKAPDLDDINNALRRFASDTAPGISGWTVPILRQAIKLPNFARFVVSLTASMAKGTAPGSSMLCTSRLTPLLKPDGGVRPIAVGELFYRLSTKAILKTAFKPDFLLPNQLGVGSKGGVEPIVRAVQRGLDGTLPQQYTHLVSLDCSNAFNTANRLDIVSSLKNHAPSLYRLAKWAYNNASDLLIGDHILKSAQGVRQGDPLGPLLFSLAIRPLISQLIAHLGPDRLVLAYLDDIYILSKDGTALEDTFQFFDSANSSLRLNKRKCAAVSFDTIRTDGFKLLGTLVGPTTPRLAFLDSKTAAVFSKLDELRHLPHQHALILLRQCIQQDVRHLQRTLKTDDLPNCWAALDARLEKEVGRLTAGDGKDSTLVSTLLKLPARLGGLGVLSYSDVAPHAWAAAQAESDSALTALLGQAGEREHREGSPEEPRKSQQERCKDMWEGQRDKTLEKMGDKERKLLVEAASPIGRKWLSIIPYNQPLRLSDYDVATGLAYRLQVPPKEGHCMWCGDNAELGHDELCLVRPRGTIGRHDAIVRVIGRHLASNHSTTVDIEPHTQEGRRRNDIQWHGAPSHGRATVQFDVKVVSLLGAKSHRTTTKPPADTELAPHASKQCIKHLDSVARHATSVRPLSTSTFKPLVFSTGGLMSKETADEVQSWKAVLGESMYGRLGSAISLELVKARARTYGLLR